MEDCFWANQYDEWQTKLERGEYPIVKVRTKNGVFYWVTLTEADLEEGSFYCLDPLNGKVSLDKYGNRVYGIRLVTKK